MKILPIELVEVIHAAYLSLKGDEKYQLRPFYRQLIYQAIGSLGTYNTVQIRGWLAVLTARYILSARQHALPDDGRLLEEVLDLAARVLQGTVSSTSIPEAVAQLNTYVDAQFGDMVVGDTTRYYAYTIYNTVIHTLYEVAGSCALEDAIIEEGATDEWDIDVYSADAAKWAAISWAGDADDPQSNADRRLIFWEWWLYEAIPTAWPSLQ